MRCLKCQSENPEGAKFCNECGQSFSDKVQPAQPHPAAEGERKRVTALFSDLSGYTAMTEKLDPEEVKEITGRIFDGVRGIVTKYEGFTEHFAGDGVLILFGVPKSHEDDPVRAIHAAREIHELVDSLSPQYVSKVGRALSMHSGVNTGLAVTSDVDPEKGTHGVTGDAINVASRLSDLAAAREILVGPDTYRASVTHFAFEALTPTKVKGKTEPICVYKVLSTRGAAPRVRADRQVSSEMVGRDAELAKLELQILKAVNGEGSVVNVIGEAGIGKSRLIAELKQRDVMKRVMLLEGRAISIGKNLSFHPIIDLLKQWARIAEDDGEPAARDKLESAVRRVCGEETDEVFPFVATMMGMKLTGRHAERVKGIEGEGLEKLIVKNVRELVIMGSELRPTVIIMEDLHWADTSSIELLESLFRLVEKYRILFINVFRPGYWQTEDRKVENIGQWLPDHHVEIGIRPLDKHSSEALINNMLDIIGLPHGLKEQIIERAGGNPFFIEEVVRSLIDEGAVVRKERGFEVTEKIDRVVIPPTINDVLMARIDRLEERTRELVKVASVIGRSFFDRIIKDVAGSIENVDGRLAYLKDVQLIRDRIRMQELEYLFKHALAQEAAYESTLLQHRKALHLRVAQSIERIFPERLHEFYGRLAYHYGEGEDSEKAEEYMAKAGEEALRSSASSEALSYFQEALKLYVRKYGDAADPDKLATFEKNIALAHFNRAQWSDALSYFNKVFERWGVQGPTNKIRIAIKFVCDLAIILLRLYLPFLGQKKMPDRLVNEYFDLAEKKDVALLITNPRRYFIEMIGEFRESLKYDLSKLHRAAAFHALVGGGLFSFAGFRRIGELILGNAKKLVDETKIEDVITYHAAASVHNCLAGKWSEIPEYDAALIDACMKSGLFWDVVVYSVWHEELNIYRGEFGKAREILKKYVVLEEKYQFTVVVSHILSIELFVMCRSLDRTHTETSKALSLSVDKGGVEPLELLVLGWKAVTQVLMKDILEAEDALEHAERIRRKQFFWPPWYISINLLGRFMLDLHLLEQAIGGDSRSSVSEYTRAALKSGKAAVKNSAKVAPLLTWNYRLMGTYYWLIGNQRKALKWWNKSIQEGERLGARPDLSRTYFEVGKRLLEPQSKYKELNGIDSHGYLEKAGILFEEMGLERDLEDLERVKREI